jgi:uncharacterized glyoxalase superfamily protein PhnB
VKFASVRLVTTDVTALARFYHQLTGIEPTQAVPDFAEVRLPGATLAISSARAVAQFNANAAHPADNHTAIIELEVEDVDAHRARLADLVATWVMEPTQMPWGNRSMLLRDPDGNLINVYARPAR